MSVYWCSRQESKMLFEHDIIKMRSYNRGCHETEIYFKNGKFAVDGSHYGFKDICSNSVEFVRNKFDNPELLEVQNEHFNQNGTRTFSYRRRFTFSF